MAKIAFLTTVAYQLHHYSAISRHLDSSDVTFVIEQRDGRSGLSPHDIQASVGDVNIEHASYERLAELDGRFDVIVCQTPVLPNRLLAKSVVVAQQYSLAKSAYQFGAWRSLCSMNLMYGPDSMERVRGFCAATPVGNPLFDNHIPINEAGTPGTGLYLPTYGSLSSYRETLDRISEVDARFIVKPHHASALDSNEPLPPNCVPAGSEQHPIELMSESSFVVSELSGAAYDAIAARRPLLLAGAPDSSAHDLHRVGADELSNAPLMGHASRWDHGRLFHDALAEASELAELPGKHEAFIERYYVNFGNAGPAAAEQICNVASRQTTMSFGQTVVRRHVAQSLTDTQELRAENARLKRSVAKLQSRRQRATAPTTDRLETIARRSLARWPWLNRRVVATRRRRRQ